MSATALPFIPPRRHALRALVSCVLLAACDLAAQGHGALDERIAELTEDLAKAPADAAIHFALAEANANHEDWETALWWLARVEELAPGRFPVDLVSGQAQLGAGRAEEAREALSRFLATHPGNPRALLLRARAFERLGKDALCLADYGAALAADAHPEPDLFQEAAEALAFRGREEEAIDVLAAGIDKLGPVPSLVLKAMSLELGAKRFDAALSRIEAMQKSAPRPEPWMAKRAAVLEQAGRAEEARAAWEALAAHLAALPNLERGSHAMSLLAEQAQTALRGQSSPSQSPSPTALP